MSTLKATVVEEQPPGLPCEDQVHSVWLPALPEGRDRPFWWHAWQGRTAVLGELNHR